MDTTSLSSQFVALRAGDGAIERHLAELDAKLNAWLAAMAAGRVAILELARRAVPSGGSGESAREPVDADGTQELPAEPLSDEALLRTLDPETAHAIRVKRRLTQGARSVRELLDEYRAAQAQPQAQSSRPDRRGWWRRKNG
jgi:hypothetical protein